MPLILFSGLGADAGVFTPQKRAFPQLVVPKWPTPRPGDTLRSYCQRIAEQMRPNRSCVVGGASFGGMIALETARYLDPLAVLLIGSIRSPAQLPRHVKYLRPLRSATSILPLGALQWSVAPLAANPLRRIFPHLSGLAGQFCNADRTVFRWSVNQLLSWNETPRVDCPVFQIHGDRDRVLPMKLTTPDVVVPGGGHVISLTHASAVNELIRACLERVGNGRQVAY